MWFFKKDNNSVTLVTDADDTALTVSAVRKLDEKDSVEVVAGKERHTFLLKDFKYAGSSFSRNFEKCVQSRTMFVKAWSHFSGHEKGEKDKMKLFQSSDTSLNEEPDSLPVIKKKKYSITVGRKPNQNEKKATQSSQESANEEEIEANEERNVSTKECVHILGQEKGQKVKKVKAKSSKDGQNVEQGLDSHDDGPLRMSTGLMADNKMKGHEKGEKDKMKLFQSSDTSLNEEPDSLPVIKKKKYSITVGRKPNQNEKKATQSSQESANEEEIEANEERNVSTKECVHILGQEKGQKVKKVKAKSSKDGQNVEQGLDSHDDGPLRMSTGLMADNKMKGVCVQVHIDNIIVPDQARKVRDLDPEHVKKLKAEFRQYRSPFLMFAGHVPKNVDIDSLKQPSEKPMVEVIGGQHTCAAFRELYEEGVEDCSLVNMNIFTGLTNMEALEIGFQHNEMIKLGKPLGFIDFVKMLRFHLFSGQTVDERKQKKKEISLAFGFKLVTPFNRKYCKYMACAAFQSTVYEKVLEVHDKWEKRQIKNQQKKPLNQSILGGLFIGGITNEERIDLLDCMLTEVFKVDKDKTEVLTKYYKDKKEKNTTEAAVSEVTSDGIDDVDSTVETDESDDESQSKNGQETGDDLRGEKVHSVQSENEEREEDEEKDQLTQECSDLKILVESLNDENMRLKEEIKRLESVAKQREQNQENVQKRKRLTEDTEEDISPKTTTEKKGDGKRKGKTEDVESKTKTEMKDDRKRRRKTEVTEWSVGDKCEGYFVPHKVWYEAKILKKIDEDIYKVKYKCDGYTEDLPLELLRPV